MAEKNKKDALSSSEIFDVLKEGRKVSVGEKCSQKRLSFFRVVRYRKKNMKL